MNLNNWLAGATGTCLIFGMLPLHAAVEQRLKVEGTWKDERFIVSRVQERDPSKDSNRIRILGAVDAIDSEARTLSIGPVTIQWDQEHPTDTTLLRVGDVVEVDARQVEDGPYRLLRLTPSELEEAGQIELIGTVTNIENVAGAVENRVAISGISTWVPRRLYSNGRIRLLRLDDKRPENQFHVQRGDVGITVGGEFEFISEYSDNEKLDNDELASEQQFQLETFIEFGESLSAFVEFDGGWSQELDLDRDIAVTTNRIRRREIWVNWDQPLGLPIGVQIGKQNISEQREWWWDDNLDAIRVYYNGRAFSAEAAIADQLWRDEIGGIEDAEDADVRRILGRASWRPSSAFRFDTFFLAQKDDSSQPALGDIFLASMEDEDDSDLTWAGVRISGEFDLAESAEMSYWLDTARVSGTETAFSFDDFGTSEIIVDDVERFRRDGRGFDLGLSFGWGRSSSLEPTLTLGLARGSGGENRGDSFRQTGMHDNTGRFNGVDRFRYYGELARPELSNLEVSTLSLGFRIKQESSFEFTYHGYRQLVPSTDHPLRVKSDADGLGDQLGTEFDIIVGLEEWKHWELEIVASRFELGPALVGTNSLWRMYFKANFNF